MRIEHDEIGLDSVEQRTQIPRASSVRDAHAIGLQIRGDAFAQRPIVVDDQDVVRLLRGIFNHDKGLLDSTAEIAPSRLNERAVSERFLPHIDSDR
ncbi:hypothetical protein [Paraburkholderia sp.]|uniref:hypothetical protein n=1 Tax=Paraburkholderia sp. TaxID=1926495 RepID=UPI00286F7C7F|nr:hypothetical protein [Paraburkholderia sp.]